MTVAVIGALAGIWLHELAHQVLAAMAGDRSGFVAGRLTLNPFAQFSVVGTFLAPALFMHLAGVAFGWGRPALVDLASCRRWGLPGIYMVLLMPCLLNLVLVVLLWYAPGLRAAAHANLAIGLINLVPVPGTDGWHAFRLRRSG